MKLIRWPLASRMVHAMMYGVLVVGSLSPARAAPSSPTPPPAPQFAGPVISGLCILNRQGVFELSKVGKFANGRFKQLRDATQSAVSAEEAKLIADAKKLATQKGSLAPAQFQQRQQQIADRYTGLRAHAAQDSRDMEATRQDIVTRVSKEAQPVILAVYQSRHCGVLLGREAVLAGNPALDVTSAVVQGLNARISSINVERKHIASPQSPKPLSK